jgi:hypothetical protein
MFLKFTGIAMMLLVSAAVSAQSYKVTKLSAGDIPKDVGYKGEVKNAVRWSDKNGQHIVVTTETGTFTSKNVQRDIDPMDALLYVHHFVVKNGKAVETWKITDGVKECPLDIQVAFIKNTFHVTDLDNDGIAEVWVMYKTACHGDVSPCDMKVIMYEGAQKYAMRGENRVKISETEQFGGEYKFDAAFQKGSKLFREHAKKMWKDNIMEEWYNG